MKFKNVGASKHLFVHLFFFFKSDYKFETMVILKFLQQHLLCEGQVIIQNFGGGLSSHRPYIH